MLIRIFRDHRDAGGGTHAAAQLIDEVEKLTTNTEEVLTQVEVLKGDWKRDLSELQSEIKTLKSRSDSIDYDRLAKEVWKIQDAQQEEQIKNKILFPAENRFIERAVLADPWADHGGAWLDDHDVRGLIENEGLKGLDAVVRIPAQDDAHKLFARAAVDAMIMDACGRANTILVGRPYGGLSTFAPKFAKQWAGYIQAFIKHATQKDAADLMDTATELANWVPTQFSAELRALIFLQLRVAALFERTPQPTAQYPLPVDLSDTIGYLAGETTSIPSAWGINTANVQKFAPEKPTLIARKIAGQRVISGEGVEDAIVPMLPLIRNAIIRDIASGEEKGIIDGQRTSTIDTGDAPGTDDVRYAWDGIRWYVEQYTGAKVDANGTITGTMLVSALRKAMGEYGVDDTRLVHIPSANAYLDMIGIDDVRTMDKLGERATIVRGQLAQVGSAAIVPSRYVRTDLNESGIYDGTVETKTIDILVHRGGWIIGDRRKVTIEAQRWALDDAWQLVGMERVSFTNLFGTSHNMAAVLYDITS